MNDGPVDWVCRTYWLHLYREVVPVRVLSIGQIDLNCVFTLN